MPDAPVNERPTEQQPEGSVPGERPAVKGVAFHPAGQYQECGSCSSLILDQFAKSFDKSARRWELVVYPSLAAFIILAMYGFFLIYSLTQDIRLMSTSIDPQMGRNMGSLAANIGHLANNIELMSTHLEYISDNMETMSVDMRTMSENVDHMAENVAGMSGNVQNITRIMTDMSARITDMSNKLDSLAPMTASMSDMSHAMRIMTGSVGRMGYDMNNAARPMSFINRFMPW
ncbi:MAG: methyl-accepting chemotaxis protein [Magnetococcales bacterium]|nr:methyl-accepting chemotaxis protein [Magnetococcales bacterium]